ADPGTKGESRNPAGAGVRVVDLQPVQRRGGVAQLALAAIEAALRPADAAEIEAQDGESLSREGVIDSVDDPVVHGTAMLRMRMQHERDGSIGPAPVLVATFQSAFRAVNDDFGHL